MREKNIMLDAEEAQMLRDFEAGHFKPVVNEKKEIKRIKQLVAEKHNKVKRVNLRMTLADFMRAQAKALEEGLPYQTLLSSVLHKYLTGRLFDRHAF